MLWGRRLVGWGCWCWSEWWRWGVALPGAGYGLVVSGATEMDVWRYAYYLWVGWVVGNAVGGSGVLCLV